MSNDDTTITGRKIDRTFPRFQPMPARTGKARNVLALLMGLTAHSSLPHPPDCTCLNCWMDQNPAEP